MNNVIVTLEELSRVPLPVETSTYTPVAHKDLVNLVYEKADKIGFTPTRNEFKAARDGNVMSGRLIFVGEESGIDMQVGLINSYDKTKRAVLGVGAEVFICLNGVLSAEYKMHRKHTINVWRDLENMAEESVNNLYLEYKNILAMKHRLNGISMPKRFQAEMLGRIFVEEEIVTPTMANIVRKEIQGSTMHPDDTVWSFYNHVTYSLRQSHPMEYINNHVKFHQFMAQQFN